MVKILFHLQIFSALVCFLSLGGCAKYSEEVQANLTKLKTTKSCSGCDLTEVELVGFDLKNADLIGANLTSANLSRVDLTEANLTNANLTDASLVMATLTGAKLVNTNLSRVKLSYANITGVDISDSLLVDASMNSSKILNSKISNTDMTGANLHRANLSGTKITDKTLKDSVLCETIMPSGRQDDSGCKGWLQQPKVLIVPSGMIVLQKITRSRVTPVNFTPVKFAKVRFDPDKLALVSIPFVALTPRFWNPYQNIVIKINITSETILLIYLFQIKFNSLLPIKNFSLLIKKGHSKKSSHLVKSIRKVSKS